MDELRAIRTFLAVAREGSFSEAARQLSTTPATVTRAVAALENHLKTQLFVRTTRQVSLTHDGAAYAARVQPLVDGLEAASDELSRADAAAIGRLRLNAPMSFGLRVLPDLIAAFRQHAPGVDVSITLQDQLIDIVAGEYDLSVRISEPPKDKSTIWRKICRVDRYIVARPGSSIAKTSHPGELQPDLCFGFGSTGDEELWDLQQGQERARVIAGKRVSSNNGDVLSAVIEKGDGCALLPGFIVREALAAGRLVQILPHWHPPDLWLSLFYPPYDRLPPRVAVFSSFFEQHVTVTRPVKGLQI